MNKSLNIFYYGTNSQIAEKNYVFFYVNFLCIFLRFGVLIPQYKMLIKISAMCFFRLSILFSYSSVLPYIYIQYITFMSTDGCTTRIFQCNAAAVVDIQLSYNFSRSQLKLPQYFQNNLKIQYIIILFLPIKSKMIKCFPLMSQGFFISSINKSSLVSNRSVPSNVNIEQKRDF